MFRFGRRSARSFVCVFESRINGTVTQLEISCICCMAVLICLRPFIGLWANDTFIKRIAYIFGAPCKNGVVRYDCHFLLHVTEDRQGKAREGKSISQCGSVW